MTAEGRRLPLPCSAPLPTGYCLVSDRNDFIGGGKASQAGGENSVEPTAVFSENLITLSLQNEANGDDWNADFKAPAGEPLVPGLYAPATRYPFQLATVAGLSITGNGRGCNQLNGRFSVEELERHPAKGLVRLSVTFEQHCEGGASALRGVINFNATGSPDPTPEPDETIALDGKVFRLVYDPAQDLAYGLDASNRRLAKIDLTSGEASYADIVQVPNDACLDTERERLYVVNKGSSLITEYDTSDLSAVRDIAWAGADWGPDETRFKIYCAAGRVYVVDGAWAPGLFSIDGLEGAEPVVVDHSEQVAGVGGLVLNASGSDLYYWYQHGWSAGRLNTAVHRLDTTDLSQIDVTSEVGDFSRDPLDAPLLLDEDRGLVFSKNKVFDADNLAKLVYSLPSAFDTFDGAAENAYALDPVRGRLATKRYIYELERYDIHASTVVMNADQLFFDATGALWFLSVSKGVLLKQMLDP